VIGLFEKFLESSGTLGAWGFPGSCLKVLWFCWCLVTRLVNSLTFRVTLPFANQLT